MANLNSALPAEMAWRAEISHAWLEIQGNLVELKIRRNLHHFTSRTKRGKIRGFSRKARMRLLSAVNRIDWQTYRHHTFLTLTYPDQLLPNDPTRRNRDRDNFLGYLERHLGRPVTGIWRVEWMPRKSGIHVGKYAPHFHLVLIGVPFLRKELFKDWWASTLVYQDKNLHVRVDGPQGDEGAFYAAKYCAKRDLPSELAIVPYLGVEGRHYGFVRKNLLPFCPTTVFADVTGELLELLCDWVQTELPWTRADEKTSAVLFGEKGKNILKKLRAFEIAEGLRLGYDVLNNGGNPT